MKSTKKLISIAIISLFLLTTFGISSNFALSIRLKLEKNAITTTGMNYKYGMYLFDSWFNQTWDHMNIITNLTNSDSGFYSYTSEDFTDINESTFLEKITYDVVYETNTSFYSNETISGKQAYHLVFDSYNVNVSYGDGIKLMWLALKNGTLNFIQEVSELKSYDEYNLSEFNEITKTTTLFNDTDNDGIFEDPIQVNIEQYNETHSQQINDSYDMFENPSFVNVTLMRSEKSFNMIWPLIMSTQIYTTENDQKVAWGKMIFPEYFLYNDTDGNGIYSLGKSQETSGFGMDYCDEHKGNIFPQLRGIVNGTQTLFYKDGSSITQKGSQVGFPSDITIEKLAENITFHDPQETEDGLSWSIDYDELPIQCSSDTNESVFSINQGKYRYCSPTNISYGFNYNITQNRADLSQTFGMSKMSNSTFYDKVQGLSLSIPYYTYFISSEEIKQETYNGLSMPTDFINFTLGGNATAFIDMGEYFPQKRNYTLYDYPSQGVSIENEALGATINQLIVSTQEKASVGGYSRVFILKGLMNPTIENDPDFENYTALFTMASVNYPVWSGEKLAHDPTFTVFYSDSPPEDGDGVGAGEIPGFLYIPLFATIVITVAIIVKKVVKKPIDRE